MIGTLFGIGPQHPETGIFVDGCVLKQSQGFIGNTTTRDNFHIYLDSLSGMRHLFVGLWFILLFFVSFIRPSRLSTRYRNSILLV